MIKKNEKKQPAYIEDGYLAIQQLGIKPNENDKQDAKWLTLILGKYLRCGSWKRADQHRMAMSIGKSDIVKTEDDDIILESEIKDYQNFQELMQLKTEMKQRQKKIPSKRCRCCGLLISQQITDSTIGIESIQNLGICNRLYFITIYMIGVMFLLTVLILCFYSLITNIVASAIYRNYFGDAQLANQDNTFKGILMTSYGSKRNMESNYSYITITVQCWLTFITVCLMGYLLYLTKYSYIEKENIFNQGCQSPGKFSVFLANVPIHLYGKDKRYFQSVFQQYIENVKRALKSDDNESYFQTVFGHLDEKIQVQNVTYIMPTLLKALYKERKKDFKQLQQEKKSIRQDLIKIITQRKERGYFSKSNEQLSKKTAQIDNLWKRQMNQRHTFMDKIKQMDTEKQRQRFKTFSVIVTFNNIKNKELILALHARQQSLIYKLFYIHFKQKKFLMMPNEYGERTQVKVFLAPEPEDIIWKNHTVTHPYRIAMIVLMHLTTVALLAISFIVVYFLSGQSQIMSNSYEYKKSFWVISLVINVFLQAFDLLIGFSIKTFTRWERHCSQTDVQTSIATKTIMAVLVNSTLIPACIFGLIKRNVFGVEGLADTIFMQSIIKVATAILVPLVQYALNLLKICWKKLTCNLLKVKQKQLNTDFEKPAFQIGKNYAQLVGLYYFGCFYCNLQPLIAIIVGSGIVILYITKRLAVYRFLKRPVQGSSEISHAIDNFIYLGPIVFAIGNFLWTDGFSLQTNIMTRIPNILTLLVSLVIFFAPFQETKEIRELKKQKKYSQQKYKDQRIFFSSEYARKNPLTQNKAILQHQEYLRNYFKELQQKYNSINKQGTKSEQKQQSKRNLNNQLQKLQSQFGKQSKFGYADEEYFEDGEYYNYNDQPCIVVDVNNIKPKILMMGFNYLNQFENQLKARDRYKGIPVYVNVGDWDTSFRITCVNLQNLGFSQKDLQEIDQIIAKIVYKKQSKDISTVIFQSSVGRLNYQRSSYHNQINGSNYQYQPPLSFGKLAMQGYQNPQFLNPNTHTIYHPYEKYSPYPHPAQYQNNLQHMVYIPNMQSTTQSGGQHKIAMNGMPIPLTSSTNILYGSNRQNLPVRMNITSPNYR